MKAFERIADALTLLAKIEARKFDKLYPVRQPKDATVTKIPTDEDRARANISGDISEPIDDWASPGPLERAFLERERTQNNPKGRKPEAGRAETPGSDPAAA